MLTFVTKLEGSAISTKTQGNLVGWETLINPVLKRIGDGQGFPWGSYKCRVVSRLCFPLSVQVVRHQVERVQQLSKLRYLVRLVNSAFPRRYSCSQEQSWFDSFSGFHFEGIQQFFAQGCKSLFVLGRRVSTICGVFPVQVQAIKSKLSQHRNRRVDEDFSTGFGRHHTRERANVATLVIPTTNSKESSKSAVLLLQCVEPCVQFIVVPLKHGQLVRRVNLREGVHKMGTEMRINVLWEELPQSGSIL